MTKTASRSRSSPTSSPPANLKDLVAEDRAAVPVFLIAAPNSPQRRGAQPRLRARRRRRPATLWEIPESGHVGGTRHARRSTSGAWSASSTRRWRHEPPALRRGAGVQRRHRRWCSCTRSTTRSCTAGRGSASASTRWPGLIALAAAIAGVLAFPSLRPGLRAALAFAFGGLALVNGMMHVLHVQKHGAAGGDVTGALAAAAGVVLVGLAVAIPWRHRGEGDLAQARTSPCPAGCSALSSCSARSALASSRRTSGASRSATRRAPPTRTSRSRPTDGLELAGWYRPSQQRRVRWSSCTAAAAIARARSPTPRCSPATATACCSTTPAGAARATACENNYGWDWAKDIAGALDVPQAARRTSTRAGSARSASRPAPTSLIEVAAERTDLARDGHRRRRRRLVRGLAPPPGHRARHGARLDDVRDDPR